MKKLLLILLIGLLGGLCWYLFIKKYDYQFQTTAKYGPGAVAYELSEWKNLNSGSKGTEAVPVQNENFRSIIQKIGLENSDSIEFKWELNRINDSATAITVNVLSSKNQIANRLAIVNPFQESLYIDSLKQKLIRFKKQLNDHQSLYRITPSGNLEDSPEKQCVCSTSRNIPLEAKASEMMATISSLENYILTHKIQLDGYPFLKVTNWNREKGLIDFDFCFPVENIDSLPSKPNLYLKEYTVQQSLKLSFFGNYRISHISWFDLLYLADEKGYEVTGGPMEVYHDNPKIDSDELNWEAEIYLPVKK